MIRASRGETLPRVARPVKKSTSSQRSGLQAPEQTDATPAHFRRQLRECRLLLKRRTRRDKINHHVPCFAHRGYWLQVPSTIQKALEIKIDFKGLMHPWLRG